MTIDRRSLIKYAAVAPIMSAMSSRLRAAAHELTSQGVEYTLRIAPISLELAPGKIVEYHRLHGPSGAGFATARG